MKRAKHFRRALAAALALLVAVQAGFPAVAAESDYEYVTGHVKLALTRELGIIYPPNNVQTTAGGYYITGTSDPDQELLLNGSAVSGRGANGVFAVWVTLGNGANSFAFSQGGAADSVTITKGAVNVTPVIVSNPDTATKPLPQFDLALKTGVKFTFRCAAPSGSTVTAQVNGKSYKLTGNGLYYTGTYTMPGVEGTVDLGEVTYKITSNGQTSTIKSEGRLYAYGKEDTLQIRVKNVSATVFTKASLAGDFVTTAKSGMVSNVKAYSNDMYQLSMGGWIPCKSVQPLTGKVMVKNTVSGVSFSADDGGETYTLRGASHPLYTAKQTADKLTLTFYNTTGVGAVDTSDSSLFSGAKVTEKDGRTTITFTQAESGGLWGYLVEYRDGDTRIYCKYKPRLSGDSGRPLAGMTVAVDPGHGGKDYGALGITYGASTAEKQINLATAIALQKKLELLGAEVILTREGDDYLELDPRMQQVQAERADLMISLHCNSVGLTSTATTAKGVEVFYYEPIAKALAEKLSANISEATGRTNRGAKYSNFMVTLNSYAPSVLVEMGFLFNPAEYDNMTSKRGVYNTVTAICDGIVDLFA